MKEKYNVSGNRSLDNTYTDTGRRISDLAAQQVVGLRPQRWAWAGCGDPDCPAAHRRYIGICTSCSDESLVNVVRNSN